MKSKVLPYCEEINSIYRVINHLRNDNLEDIVKSFEEDSNQDLKTFGEFAKRVKEANYSNLSDYLLDLSNYIFEGVVVGKINPVDSASMTDAFRLMHSFLVFAYETNEKNSNRVFKGMALMYSFTGYHEEAESAIEKLKEAKEDSLFISLAEAYNHFMKDKIGGADEIIKATEELIYYEKDAPIHRLWRAEAYIAKRDYEKAKEELKEAEKKGVFKEGLYNKLMSRITSREDLKGLGEALNSYWKQGGICYLFPPKEEIKMPNLNPSSMFG